MNQEFEKMPELVGPLAAAQMEAHRVGPRFQSDQDREEAWEPLRSAHPAPTALHPRFVTVWEAVSAGFATPDNAPMNPPGSILDRIGRTPLVRLGRIGTGLPIPILGKCEFLNLGGSIKDRIAKALVDDPEASGLLPPG